MRKRIGEKMKKIEREKIDFFLEKFSFHLLDNTSQLGEHDKIQLFRKMLYAYSENREIEEDLNKSCCSKIVIYSLLSDCTIKFSASDKNLDLLSYKDVLKFLLFYIDNCMYSDIRLNELKTALNREFYTPKKVNDFFESSELPRDGSYFDFGYFYNDFKEKFHLVSYKKYTGEKGTPLNLLSKGHILHLDVCKFLENKRDDFEVVILISPDSKEEFAIIPNCKLSEISNDIFLSNGDLFDKLFQSASIHCSTVEEIIYYLKERKMYNCEVELTEKKVDFFTKEFSLTKKDEPVIEKASLDLSNLLLDNATEAHSRMQLVSNFSKLNYEIKPNLRKWRKELEWYIANKMFSDARAATLLKLLRDGYYKKIENSKANPPFSITLAKKGSCVVVGKEFAKELGIKPVFILISPDDNETFGIIDGENYDYIELYTEAMQVNSLDYDELMNKEITSTFYKANDVIDYVVNKK